MKTILERHAERLTPDERRATWQAVSAARASATRMDLRWALAAAAVTVVVAVALFGRVSERPTPVSTEHARPRPLATLPVVPAPATPAAEAVPHAAARPGEPAARARTHERTHSAPVAVAPPAAVPAAPEAPAPAVRDTRGKLKGTVRDAQQQPVAYANVIVLGTRTGAMTNENGDFVIPGLEPGKYDVKLMATGYDPVILPGVEIAGGEEAQADFHVGATRVVKQIDEIQVQASRRLETKSSATKRSISAEKLREIPVDNLSRAAANKAGSAAPGDNLHYRGGRPGEVKPQFGRLAQTLPPVPVVPTTGGTRLPNDEAFDSMFFKNYGVNPFIPADEDPLSTFAVDVDAASYTVTRRYLELGQLPPADAVRVEEFVNFFAQGYPHFEQQDFRILLDGAPSPFGPGYHLVRVGLKGREVPARERKDARLTFVVDVSGSMAREDRLELVKRALRLLVDQLRPGDRVGLVVYGTQGRVLLEPAALGGGGRGQLLGAIGQLRPEGSTNAEEGLRLGYEMARRAFRADAINRIVLCSDGVANVGRTGPGSILEQVRTEADRGIQLTTIGFGMGNYNDVLMEQLADKGDGNHYYVDDLDEAHRVFVENLTGTLQVIAKDAKVQVEFDSTRVLRYRLLGFENRDVADRDFRNDKVDAGEIGAGHEVTALYEVKLVPGVASGTIATVRFRYARPGHEAGGAPDVRELAQRLDAADLGRRFEDAAPRFRLDAAVAEFAEILRGSYWAKEGRLADVLAVARRAAGSLHDEAADGFVSLVEKAAKLDPKAEPGGPKQE